MFCLSPRCCRRGSRPPTVKQRLAAVRMLFDWLVVGQVVSVNQAASVRECAAQATRSNVARRRHSIQGGTRPH
jgi:site-specific recombinase XerC